jgi:hypothetical protein
MDASKRARLIEKICEIGLDENSETIPVVSLEDFFDGNDDMGSIGCNLLDHPGVEYFYRVLSEIDSNPKVSRVLVGILEVEESDETMWPFSDAIYIVTSATTSEVTRWVAALEADDVYECSADDVLPRPLVNSDERVIRVWWD